MLEEAAVIKALLNVELPVYPYTATHTAMVGEPDMLSDVPRGVSVSIHFSGGPRKSEGMVTPGDATLIKALIDAAQGSFRLNLQGVYFRQHFKFAGTGIAVAWFGR